jgi:hypothetical protein
MVLSQPRFISCFRTVALAGSGRVAWVYGGMKATFPHGQMAENSRQVFGTPEARAQLSFHSRIMPNNVLMVLDLS